MNIPIITPSSPDHKLSNTDMLKKCVHDIQWLAQTLFGARDKDGKLLKYEHKDKDGKVINTSYRIGLLQKFEGTKDFDEKTQKEVLLQKGMEQLWMELRDMYQVLALNQKIQRAVFAVMAGIKVEDMAGIMENRETEVNAWLQNYETLMAKKMEEMQKQEAEQAEKLKDFKPNADTQPV